MIGNKKAFTLVELIGVMVVLVILGTIAFISFQGYAKTARDSGRVTDVNSITKSLEVYYVNNGTYPTPTGATPVSYSGTTVWTQGTVGDDVIEELGLSGPILDPLLGSEYAYSVTKLNKEFEVGAVMEGNSIASTQITNAVHAAGTRYTAYIKGTYNKKIAKAVMGNTTYLFAIPSIISSDLSNPDIIEIAANKALVYSGYNNLPSNIDIPSVENTGGFNFGGSVNIVIYEGSSDPSGLDSSALQTFAENLQNVYVASDIANDPLYENIVSMNTSDSTEVSSNIGPIINNILGGSVEVSEAAINSCTVVGEILSSTSSYGSCNTPDIIVCSGPGSSYTIAACNAGTQIGGTGATSYGELYQWGNNAALKLAGESSTQIGATTSDSTYSNTTFIKLSDDWTSIQNDNLWGNTTNTNVARQGPCENGYHVPTQLEWENIYTVGGWGTDGDAMSNALKLPMSGIREATTGNIFGEGFLSVYWASSINGVSGASAGFTSTAINPSGLTARAFGSSVRCFKN
ncbi:hypothetical protein A9Q91_01845 [Candidatus Gracilibacteria bacterium 28_42_T64]|nr:hypothetical protein A9Q91_01845 [Candidatus Gracilibacteria bacterium 28_42_T64]